MTKAKPYVISKMTVWNAYQKVRANRGAAGVDGQTLAEFEKDLENKGDAAHCFRILGRPLEWSVCSRLKRAADWEIHDSLPYGLPCFTQRRMASTSDSVSGLFT
jgi:hypothetical protein